MDSLDVAVTLTDDLRTVALAYVVEHRGGDENLEWALKEWPTGRVLHTRYRIEADIIHAIVEALRQRAYED